MLKVLSICVALLAILIGVINHFKPELFLRLPNGFIPWAMLGNRMPPYFDETPLYPEHFRKWASDGDVIIASGAKAGSIWLQTIVHLLRTGGNDDFERITDVFGLMEMLSYPEDTIDTRLERQQKKFVNYKWQQHFTHKFPVNGSKLVGLDPKFNPLIKYIVIMRHGKEVIQSFYPFMNAHTEGFKAMWGGFPPGMGSKEDALNFVTEQMPGFYFGHGKAWWSVRHEPNVLLLRYADLKKDSRSVIQQVATFLDIPLTDDTLDVVVEKSSHGYMQKRSSRYLILTGPKFDTLSVEEGGHIRKDGGKSDGGAAFFTPAMHLQWAKAVKKYWGDEEDLVTWILGPSGDASAKPSMT